MVQNNQNLLYSYTNILKRFILALTVSTLLLLTLGCDENNSSNGNGQSIAEVLGIALDTTPPAIVSDPTVTMAPNPDTPLAGLLELETDEPTRVTVIISEDTATNSLETRAEFDSMMIEFDELQREHSLPLLGFTPDNAFSVEILVSDKEGNQTIFPELLTVTTDPLPDDFPPIEVTSNPEKMEPGVTLFDIGARGVNLSFGEAFVAVNERGDVVWYHKAASGGASDVRMLPNGNLLFLAPQTPTEIIEMDMLGNVIRRWHSTLTSGFGPDSIPVLTDSFHHEVFAMENGNILALSVELVVIDGYPSSETDPEAPLETAFVAGDVIVEFSPDGTIVNEWSVLNLLDPFRLGYNSLGGFWNNRYSATTDVTRDWSHGNAVIHDPADDSILVSLRHQDAVIKFSRETGELIWILGTHQNWDPFTFGDFLLDPMGAEFLWQYHQHAPTITPEGDIIIFDNGNFRASPADERLPPTENFSRAVQYQVDEDTMEIRQVWEYGEFADEIIYTPFIGDADYMKETGNVLITFGGITLDEEGLPTDRVVPSKVSAKIVEVTHETPAEVVFELSIVDETPDINNGWFVYRSERIKSLYPEN